LEINKFNVEVIFMSQDRGNFIDYLYVLIKWRKQIIITFFVVCFIAAGVSLVLPKVHRGVTTVMPPTDDSDALGLSSLISQIPLGGLGLGGMSNEAYSFLAILNSRTLMESVVDQFDLVTRYHVKNTEKAVKLFREKVKIDVNEDGTITVKADASTKWFPSEKEENEARIRARDMANYIISELDRINKELKVERAKNTRIFIEKRYLQNLDDLAKAEDKFKAFQQEYGAISLPEQTSATISAAAEIQANIISREIELNVIEKSVGKSNSEYARIKRELSEFRNRLNKLRFDENSTSDNLLFNLNEVPDLGLQYARLMRDVLLQEKIMEFILPQYEQAKIQEAKDTPTVQILDKAVVPVKRVRPKRALFVIFWGFLSFLLSSSIIFSIESIHQLKEKSPERYQKFQMILNILKNDIFTIFHKQKHVH
jgi:tyrosine-protein kinase Etk/Wzc